MTDRPQPTPRRAWLLGLAAALAAPALGPSAAAQSGRGGDKGDIDPRGPRRLRITMPNGGRFRPRRLIVRTPTGAVAARLPHVADYEGAARLPVARLPVIGPVFGPVPAAHFVRPERRLGPLYRTGDDLLADLTGLAPNRLSAYLARSIQILTAETVGVVELGLPARLRFEPARAPSGASLRRIGDAYAGQDRLLLSPPYEALFGVRLF